MAPLIMSLEEDREGTIARAAGVLRAGQLVVLPTDTVYGLAADAFTPGATQAVFTVKNRPRSLPLPVLVSRPRQAWALAANVPQGALTLASEYWPGPLTLVLKHTELEWDLGDERGTIALRMPKHDALISLLEIVGPLACTSANISGEPTPRTVQEIAEKLGDQVGLYVDGGPSALDTGSTIVDMSTGVATIVREGPIATADIARVLGTDIAR